jgi:hypothetical protein
LNWKRIHSSALYTIGVKEALGRTQSAESEGGKVERMMSMDAPDMEDRQDKEDAHGDDCRG